MSFLFRTWINGDDRPSRLLLAEPTPLQRVFDANYIEQMYLDLDLPPEEPEHDWCQQALSESPMLSTSPSLDHEFEYSGCIRISQWCNRDSEVVC